MSVELAAKHTSWCRLVRSTLVVSVYSFQFDVSGARNSHVLLCPLLKRFFLSSCDSTLVWQADLSSCALKLCATRKRVLLWHTRFPKEPKHTFVQCPQNSFWTLFRHPFNKKTETNYTMCSGQPDFTFLPLGGLRVVGGDGHHNVCLESISKRRA